MSGICEEFWTIISPRRRSGAPTTSSTRLHWRSTFTVARISSMMRGSASTQCVSPFALKAVSFVDGSVRLSHLKRSGGLLC